MCQAASYQPGFATQEPSKPCAVAVARGGRGMADTQGDEAGSHTARQRAPGTDGRGREQLSDEKPTHLCQVVPRLGTSGRVEEQRLRMDSA